jgi:hypothetical protein
MDPGDELAPGTTAQETFSRLPRADDQAIAFGLTGPTFAKWHGHAATDTSWPTFLPESSGALYAPSASRSLNR